MHVTSFPYITFNTKEYNPTRIITTNEAIQILEDWGVLSRIATNFLSITLLLTLSDITICLQG
jgi:hypothetical protein